MPALCTDTQTHAHTDTHTRTHRHTPKLRACERLRYRRASLFCFENLIGWQEVHARGGERERKCVRVCVGEPLLLLLLGIWSRWSEVWPWNVNLQMGMCVCVCVCEGVHAHVRVCTCARACAWHTGSVGVMVVRDAFLLGRCTCCTARNRSADPVSLPFCCCCCCCC